MEKTVNELSHSPLIGQVASLIFDYRNGAQEL